MKNEAFLSFSLHLLYDFHEGVVDMEIEFGHKLKQLREAHQLSQEALADKLHVTRQAVYKWEANKGYPDIQNLIRISELFEATIDDLIKNDSDFQKEISIDDDSMFESFSDPGFYLGIILILLGVWLFEGKIQTILFISGLLSMVFLTDMIKSSQSVFQKTK